MYKNTAGQKLTVFAFTANTNLPITGDATNITAHTIQNNGSLVGLGDSSATEISASNAAGYYLFDLTQAETNADVLNFTAQSSTAGVVVIPLPPTIWTRPANFPSVSISSSGYVSSNVQVWKDNAVPTSDSAGYPKVTMKEGTGTGELNYIALQRLVNHNRVVYVDPSGSDANNGFTWNTPKATINGALGVVSSGYTIMLAPGSYEVNNYINLPNFVSMKGFGWSSRIWSSGVLFASGAILNPGHDAQIEDLFIEGTSTTSAQCALGSIYTSTATQKGALNVSIKRCRIKGNEDCILLNQNLGSQGCHYRIYDSIFEGGFDALTIGAVGSGTTSVEAYNCQFFCDGLAGITGSVVRSVVCGTLGNIFLRNCYGETKNGSTENSTVRNLILGNIVMDRCTWRSAGTNAKDINAASSTTVECSCIYDRTKTGGTITSVSTDKGGYVLASSGLNNITITAPTTVAANFPDMMIQLWRGKYKKSTLSQTDLKTYADNGTTVITTQTVSDDGTTQTQSAAT